MNDASHGFELLDSVVCKLQYDSGQEAQALLSEVPFIYNARDLLQSIIYLPSSTIIASLSNSKR